MARVCYLCNNRGYFKGECPINKLPINVLHKTASNNSPSSKPVSLVSCMLSPPLFRNVARPWPGNKFAENDSTYAPFISDGSVSLVGEDREIPVKILRDTGVSQSLILTDALPFSHKSFSGDSVICGVTGHVVVPRHRIVLHSDFFCGEVLIAVCFQRLA